MLQINFYTKDNCSLCDDALQLLKLLEKEYPHTIERRDITTNVEWLREHRYDIPVLEINDDQLKAGNLTPETLEKFLQNHQK